MRFKVGDRVESLHNRIEPTGHYGVVVAVEHKPGSGGCMVTVRGDNMGDDRFPMWEHEDYFRLTPNTALCSSTLQNRILTKENTMLPITERTFMQELRDAANGMSAGNLNSDWARAYEALVDAADRLDAMQARCELPPLDGWRPDVPQNEPAA